MLSDYQVGQPVDSSHGHNSLFSNSWGEENEVAKLCIILAALVICFLTILLFLSNFSDREFTRLKKEISVETLKDPVAFETHQKTLAHMIDTFTNTRHYDYVKECKPCL